VERTVILVKPDAIHRGIATEVLHPFEKRGLKLIACKMMLCSDDLLREHYEHLVDEDFFDALRVLMTSAPIIATCWEGVDAVATVRAMCGETLARRASAGTVRGALAMSVQANVVHTSDSPESAVVEVRRFFAATEVFEYERAIDEFIYSPAERTSEMYVTPSTSPAV